MSLRYDDVIGRVIKAVQSNSIASALELIVVVRDLRGTIRLVIRGSESEAQRLDLDSHLQGELEGWFGGATLSTNDPFRKRLAELVLGQAAPWPSHWPIGYVDLTGDQHEIEVTKWRSVQRAMSKESWVDSTQVPPPWPLRADQPTVVAFHSFKGGVGRSTTLGLIAWWLAAKGQKVVVVDLDLESPGLAPLFGLAPERVTVGVLDWILGHAISKDLKPPLHSKDGVDGLLHTVVFAGPTPAPIDLIAAGDANAPAYVEKLARLDFHRSAIGESPVGAALSELLKTIRRERRPDWIFIDARAGFHDLGGLALATLAHIDVVVARHNPQTEAGLAHVIRLLKARRVEESQLSVAVQTFASRHHVGADQPTDQRQFAEMMSRLWPPVPSPICIPPYSEISDSWILTQIDSHVRDSAPFQELAERLIALSTSET